VRVTARCAGCGACLLTCPERAIRPHGGALYVRADLCTGCVECVDVCPVDAIEENVIQDGVIEKDVIEKVQQTVPGGAR
jgi:electron transport complex protein RnfB